MREQSRAYELVNSYDWCGTLIPLAAPSHLIVLERMDYVQETAKGADSAQRLIASVLPDAQATVAEGASTSISVSTSPELGIVMARIAVDDALSIIYEPSQLISFGRVAAHAAAVTHRGYRIDGDKPFALASGTFHVSSKDHVTLEFVSFLRSDLERSAEAYLGTRRLQREWISVTPERRDASRYWQRTFSYGRDVLLWPDTNELDVAADVAALLQQAAVRTFARQTPAPTRPAVTAAMKFVSANAAEKITLADIARAANVSSRVLEYGFLEDVGCTPTEFVRRTRLDGARSDLQSTKRADLSIGAIASKWHFSNVSRFSHSYLEQFGEHPRDTPRLS